MEFLRKNQKEMLEVKNTVTEVKNAWLLQSMVLQSQTRLTEQQQQLIWGDS